jgi:hypothetical protein
MAAGYKLPSRKGDDDPVGRPAADVPPALPAASPEFPDELATVAEVRRFRATGDLPARIQAPHDATVRRKTLLFRRGIVGHLLVLGYTAPAIIEYFHTYHVDIPNLTLQAIQSDMRLMRAQWRDTYQRNSEEVLEKEIAKLDALEQSAIELYEAGNVVDFQKSMIMIAKRRSALLGLDKAKKVQLDGRIMGSNLSDAELESIINAGTAIEGTATEVEETDDNESDTE